MKKIILTLSLITIMSYVSHAQVNAVISSILTATPTGTPTLGAFDDAAKLTDGIISAPVNYTVVTNRKWKLYTAVTEIAGTNLAGSAATEAPLLPGHIGYGVVNGASATVSTFVNFGALTTSFEVKEGGRGAAAVPGNTFTLRYKVTPTLATEPGTYVITVTHTVSAI